MALRCQCVQTRSEQGTRLHVFGYREGEKADIGGAKLRSRAAGALGR
jgi:hypothetical protein